MGHVCVPFCDQASACPPSNKENREEARLQTRPCHECGSAPHLNGAAITITNTTSMPEPLPERQAPNRACTNGGERRIVEPSGLLYNKLPLYYALNMYDGPVENGSIVTSQAPTHSLCTSSYMPLPHAPRACRTFPCAPAPRRGRGCAWRRSTGAPWCTCTLYVCVCAAEALSVSCACAALSTRHCLGSFRH